MKTVYTVIQISDFGQEIGSGTLGKKGRRKEKKSRV